MIVCATFWSAAALLPLSPCQPHSKRKKTGTQKEGEEIHWIPSLVWTLVPLPGQVQAQLHRSAAAVELMVVKEQVARCHKNVRRAQRIRVAGLVDGAVVGRQANAEVAVVKSIV